MQFLRGLSFFKNRPAKPFDYKPVYYDESKERIEDIKKKYASNKAIEAEASIRERMQNEWRGKRQKSVGRSNTRLFAIIVGLFFLVYLLLFK
jgi:tetrahydromethanopterin S-methyltransferase subunit G